MISGTASLRVSCQACIKAASNKIRLSLTPASMDVQADLRSRGHRRSKSHGIPPQSPMNRGPAALYTQSQAGAPADGTRKRRRDLYQVSGQISVLGQISLSFKKTQVSVEAKVIIDSLQQHPKQILLNFAKLCTNCPLFSSDYALYRGVGCPSDITWVLCFGGLTADNAFF